MFDSTSKSHRSQNYKAQRVVFIPSVDVYVAIHLAHRTIRSDAPVPLRDAVRFVQNELLSHPTRMPTDGTLGRLLRRKQKRGAALRQDLLDAVARRGPSYATSDFEIEALSRFLGVHVVAFDGQGADEVAVSSRRLDELRRASKSSHWFVVLRKRADGSGHDLGLSPTDSAKGHRIVFRARPGA